MVRWFCILIYGLLVIMLLVGCEEETTSKPATRQPKVSAKAPAKAPVQAPVPAASKEPVEEKEFYYQVEGRRDPFLPLTEIRKPVRQSEEPMTPLQSFDLNQFRLIAVIIGKTEPRAMVVAPDAKSYILKIGTKIGKNNGVVVDINENVIAIEEKYYDFSGNVRTNIQEIIVPKREGV